jgi:hypothetical protein
MPDARLHIVELLLLYRLNILCLYCDILKTVLSHSLVQRCGRNN